MLLEEKTMPKVVTKDVQTSAFRSVAPGDVFTLNGATYIKLHSALSTGANCVDVQLGILGACSDDEQVEPHPNAELRL